MCLLASRHREPLIRCNKSAPKSNRSICGCFLCHSLVHESLRHCCLSSKSLHINPLVIRPVPLFLNPHLLPPPPTCCAAPYPEGLRSLHKHKFLWRILPRTSRETSWRSEGCSCESSKMMMGKILVVVSRFGRLEKLGYTRALSGKHGRFCNKDSVVGHSEHLRFGVEVHVATCNPQLVRRLQQVCWR